MSRWFRDWAIWFVVVVVMVDLVSVVRDGRLPDWDRFWFGVVLGAVLAAVFATRSEIRRRARADDDERRQALGLPPRPSLVDSYRDHPGRTTALLVALALASAALIFLRIHDR